jgi:hypothetical protein
VDNIDIGYSLGMLRSLFLGKAFAKVAANESHDVIRFACALKFGNSF